MKLSYESEELIREIKQDITEFGINDKAYAVFKKIQGTVFLVNYLLDEETVPKSEELEGGCAQLMTLGEILDLLEKQNEII